MKLWNFNPEDGSFEYIVHDDGTPPFRSIGWARGAPPSSGGATGAGSVNLDAKTFDGTADVDIGLWPQANAGAYVQFETRPNFLKIWPSDIGAPITVDAGGAPYSHTVGFRIRLQGGRTHEV